MGSIVTGPMSSVKKQKMAFSAFSHVKPLPTDEIFNLKILYTNDKHPSKVDLGIGGRASVTMDTKHLK